jgi:hypothetical protein
MFLAVRDGIVVERSHDVGTLLKLDRTRHEVFEWNGPTPPHNPELGEPMLDPRGVDQKIQDAKIRYKNRRRREYPTLRAQLDMMYRDAMDGTTTWVDEITRIKAKYPKPTGSMD